MVEITNREQLEDWLEGKPREITLAIAARAALRTLPMMAEAVHSDPETSTATIVLPVYRAVSLAWLAGMWPNIDTKVLPSTSSAISSVTNAYITAARTYTTDDKAGNTAVAAGYAASVYSAAKADSTAADAVDAAADAATDTADFWQNISIDADAVEKTMGHDPLMKMPLWAKARPGWVAWSWQTLESLLIGQDENWQVWTDWYEDRLLGADHPLSRPLIEELELARVLILNEDWKKGPTHINALIADLEAHYRATPPAQRSAIIEVAYGGDGRLHRQPSHPPSARDDAQAGRQHAAWQAHSEQLAALEERDPGRNSPAFGGALKSYRAALGSRFEAMDVIKLGVHGTRIDAYAARADETFLEDVASEVVALSAAHGLFIRQFPEWLDYISDASGEPTADAVDAAINVAQATADAPDIIGDDVAEAAIELAEAAMRPLAANPEDRPPRLVERELLRSTGNILSGMFEPLVAFARDARSEARSGSLDGVKEFSKRATLAVAFGGTTYVLALAAGMPAEFGWIIPVLTLLKSKLKG